MTPIPSDSPDSEDPTTGKGSSKTGTVLLILGLVVLSALCVIGIIWYRRKRSSDINEERETERSRKGKRGYGIGDEKEEDDSEEDDVQAN